MMNYTLSQFNPAYGNNQGNPNTVYNNPTLQKVPSYWDILQKSRKRLMPQKPVAPVLPQFNY